MIYRFIGRSAMVMLMIGCACSSSGNPGATARGSLTTDTDSQSLPDKEQRLEFLARYLRFKSSVADAAFIIRYQDNSGGAIPGPSDWDIRAVLQVEGQASAWHEGWAPCPAETTSAEHRPAFDAAWAAPLLSRRARWQALGSSPRCYRHPRSPGSFVLVYEEDNVILYRNTSEMSP